MGLHVGLEIRGSDAVDAPSARALEDDRAQPPVENFPDDEGRRDAQAVGAIAGSQAGIGLAAALGIGLCGAYATPVLGHGGELERLMGKPLPFQMIAGERLFGTRGGGGSEDGDGFADCWRDVRHGRIVSKHPV